MGASEAMVTARMSFEKKEAGAAALEMLGSNASKAINALYDYVIAHHALPFAKEEGRPAHSANEIAAAISLVDSLTADEPSSLAGLSLKEVRRLRLGSQSH